MEQDTEGLQEPVLEEFPLHWVHGKGIRAAPGRSRIHPGLMQQCLHTHHPESAGNPTHLYPNPTLVRRSQSATVQTLRAVALHAAFGGVACGYCRPLQQFLHCVCIAAMCSDRLA